MKAQFRIAVTTRASHQVISNAPVVREEKGEGGTKTVHFAATPPLSTYLVALAVGPFERSAATKCGPTEIRVWHVPGKGKLTGFALEAARETLSRLERWFGLPYPYGKLDLVAAPDFEAGAMENAGAVFFRETLLLLDPATATLAEKKRAAEVICHELAHMWYGDLVTMAWWDDLWLNESFATWMAFHIVDDWKPEWKMWQDFQHHRAAALRLDALRHTHPIHCEVRTPNDATENFDLITYEKGASVVRMIERYLGAKTFQKGVRTYIRRHQESNATAADLWRALGEAAGEPVEPMVRPWIEQAGHPVLSLKRSRSKGHAVLALKQERFAADQPPPQARRREAAALGDSVGGPRRGRARARAPGPQDRHRRDGARRSRSRRDALRLRQRRRGRLLPPAARARRSCARSPRTCRCSRRSSAWDSSTTSGRWYAPAARASSPSSISRRRSRGEERARRPARAARTARVPRGPTRPGGRARRPERFRDWIAAALRPRPASNSAGIRRDDEPDDVRLRRAVLIGLLGDIADWPPVLESAAARFDAYLARRDAIDPNLADVGRDARRAQRRRGALRRDARCLRAALTTPQERRRFLLGLAEFRAPKLVDRALALCLTDRVPTQDVVFVLVRLLANRAGRERDVERHQEALAAPAPPDAADARDAPHGDHAGARPDLASRRRDVLPRQPAADRRALARPGARALRPGRGVLQDRASAVPEVAEGHLTFASYSLF